MSGSTDAVGSCLRLLRYLLVVSLCILAVLVISTFRTKAGHEDVPFLKDAIPVRVGTCGFTIETGPFSVPCEQYIKADGSLYVALYFQGVIAVVRKVEQDGTIGEAVWSRESQKPAVEERGA